MLCNHHHSIHPHQKLSMSLLLQSLVITILLTFSMNLLILVASYKGNLPSFYLAYLCGPSMLYVAYIKTSFLCTYTQGYLFIYLLMDSVLFPPLDNCE